MNHPHNMTSFIKIYQDIVAMFVILAIVAMLVILTNAAMFVILTLTALLL